MTSFKRTQRKYVQKAYRVRNWREYATGLRGVGARIPRPRCATIDLLAIVATAGA